MINTHLLKCFAKVLALVAFLSHGEFVFADGFVDDLSLKREQLTAASPFARFDLKLTQTEKETLKQFKVDENDAYQNCGQLPMLRSQVKTFILSLGNTEETSASIAKIIDKIAHDATQSFQSETAWVAVRAVKSTSAYDTPRWHTDGAYFFPYEGTQFKVATALSGAGTLFINLPEKAKGEFIRVQNQATANNYDEIRTQLNDIIFRNVSNHAAKIVQVNTTEGVIFASGDPWLAAIHSEPPIHTDRLFVSVVPASQTQIKQSKNICP